MAPQKALILVVDDDIHVRSSLARLLHADGYDVVTEKDGPAALETVRRLDPDVILLDVLMPEMDGFEVCYRLKRSRETRLTPVVLLTGLSAMEDRVQGIDAGADDFITKPPERLELLARVRSLVRVRHYTDELERSEAVLFALARSIEARDPYTEGHCDRLSRLGARLGEELGLGETEVTALRRAGIVHDLGKIAVPDAILLKRGKLTDAEWEVMRKHPETGERICEPINAFEPVLPIIRHHHERQDGSGYPDGLERDAVPITARILQIVDVYDALTTDRPYRAAQPGATALHTMEQEVDRGFWDPEVFQAFRGILDSGCPKP